MTERIVTKDVYFVNGCVQTKDGAIHKEVVEVYDVHQDVVTIKHGVTYDNITGRAFDFPDMWIERMGDEEK